MNRSLFLVLSLASVAAGLVIMTQSISWGSEAANAYLRTQGGGMDTSQFVVILQEHIELYRWMGAILALIGGFGLVRSLEVR